MRMTGIFRCVFEPIAHQLIVLNKHAMSQNWIKWSALDATTSGTLAHD